MQLEECRLVQKDNGLGWNDHRDIDYILSSWLLGIYKRKLDNKSSIPRNN